MFYLNVFDSNIAKILITDLIKNKDKQFEISNQTYLLKKVLFEDYSLTTLFKRAKPVKRFQIRFLEPTYFNTTRGNNVVRLPIPELIFSNLSNLWNSLYNKEEKIDEVNFLEWVNRYGFPSSLEIKTDAKEMGETIPGVGFIGWVNFEISQNENNFATFIDTLCKFGELSNLGANRTAAFGIIKYKPNEYFSKRALKK